MKLVVQITYMFLSCKNFKLEKKIMTSKKKDKDIHSDKKKKKRNAKRIL